MRVAIFGGTGFVGGYLVDALIGAGLQPVLLVRPGHADRVREPGQCIVVEGAIGDSAAVGKVIEGADAVIYNIGILRESRSRGITFAELHEHAARRVIDAAAAQGVRRFLLMSANGVKATGTDYQTSKYRAEHYLQHSGLDWTIFRPSVIFGDPRGRSEFATRLRSEVIDSPLPAPLFYRGLSPLHAGSFELSPVHVEDVAKAFVAALQNTDTIGRVFHLGGPEALSWRLILQRISATNGRSKRMLPVPAAGIEAAATLFDRFDGFPLTRGQIRMLLEGNCCDNTDLDALGIRAQRFDDSTLQYLHPTQGARRP